MNEEGVPKKGFEHENKRKTPSGENEIEMGATRNVLQKNMGINLGGGGKLWGDIDGEAWLSDDTHKVETS